MRQALIAAALVLATVVTPAGLAGADERVCYVNEFGQMICVEKASGMTPGQSSSTGSRRAPDPDYVSFPYVVKAGDPGECMSPSGVNVYCSPSGLDLPAGTPDCIKGQGFGRAPELKDEARQEWQDMSAKYKMCPEGAGADSVDPVVFAVEAWQDVPLPKPSPYIAPGWAITGKYAYLETRGERTRTYSADTPLGPLTLEATGRYYVDWGDGTKDGPHSIEGRPWPDGQITHTYIDVGTYDVVVTEAWTATWRIGDADGQLGGMRTQGRIPAFRVEQLQVVLGTG